MPSGYTSDIYSGKNVSRNDFIMKCAKSRGALFGLRDEPLDSPIPEELKPPSYHEQSVIMERNKLVILDGMTETELETMINEKYERDIVKHNALVQENLDRSARYDQLIQEVKDWVPPTEDHVELRAFCLEQLEDSKKQDDTLKYILSHPPIKPSVQDYYKDRKEAIVQSIEYHTDYQRKETEQYAKKNLWLRQLRTSLNDSTGSDEPC